MNGSESAGQKSGGRAFYRNREDLVPGRPAPVTTVGLLGWLRANLFASWFNTILTIAAVLVLWRIVPPLLGWALFEADFSGVTGEECTGAGACWAWIDQRIAQFLYGFYPADSYWRVNVAVILLIPAVAYILFDKLPYARYGRRFSIAYVFIAVFLLVGGLPVHDDNGKVVGNLFGFHGISTDQFGGFMLNLTAGLAGIVLSLPIGILLALGRRSRLPVVRFASIGFIEVIRGVPLITLLFVAVIILELFLPPGVGLDQLVRVMVMITAFSSAYMAEVIRGGLQAIPDGQYEAAQAMGLSYWKMMRLVILPQALKIAIPGIVNTFIGLFKDTTLVVTIGLFDILGQARLLQTNPEWIGKVDHETFLIAALFFFVICFSMSRYSINLEKRLDTTRR
ncbi:MAG: amino acid ABC transporter permease [Spirochaetaceae bacterium]|nr:amino acid ABC transporter permease [Spirochaetaceae bacterium]